MISAAIADCYLLPFFHLTAATSTYRRRGFSRRFISHDLIYVQVLLPLRHAADYAIDAVCPAGAI